MRRILLIMMTLLMLCGCGKDNDDIGIATQLRSRLQNSEGCTFDAIITSDYGDEVYTFTLNCNADRQGNMTFTVIEPESISGITGKIDGEKGAITFDDKVLAFATLADGYITPVVSPWVMIHSLIGGYITSCSDDCISLNDSYADDALQLDVWINDDGDPKHCEILYKERRCLTIDVVNFRCL